jgi:hypothetical protein
MLGLPHIGQVVYSASQSATLARVAGTPERLASSREALVDQPAVGLGAAGITPVGLMTEQLLAVLGTIAVNVVDG